MRFRQQAAHWGCHCLTRPSSFESRAEWSRLDPCPDPLGDRVVIGADDDAILSSFLEHVEQSGLTLYPAQEQALLEIASGKNLILNTPTGSGKSLVASFVHFRALARGERSVLHESYQSISQREVLYPVLSSSALIASACSPAMLQSTATPRCCVAQQRSSPTWALREGADANIDHLVMDEFHYYSDPERGVAWQIPLLLMHRARFTLMSATLGDTKFFEERLTDLTWRRNRNRRLQGPSGPLGLLVSRNPFAPDGGRPAERRSRSHLHRELHAARRPPKRLKS